jgi:hypothetical protein
MTLMKEAEDEQRVIDTFWGLDDDLQRFTAESEQMRREDRHSAQYEIEMYRKLIGREWEIEDDKTFRRKKRDNELLERKLRRRYIQFLHQVDSSRAITSFSWPTKPRQMPTYPVTEASKYDYSLNRLFDVSAAGSKGGIMVLNENIGGSKGASRSYHTLQDDLASQSLVGVDPDLKKLKSSARRKEKETKKDKEESIDQMNIGPAISPQAEHIEMLDGHPMYKWDQKAILEAAFLRMGGESSGQQPGDDAAQQKTTDKTTASSSSSTTTTTISAADVSAKINDPVILALLRYTVFGVWCKRRQWSKFESLFRLRSEVTIEEFWAAAHAECTEDGVTVDYLRSDATHTELGYMVGPWIQLIGHGSSGWFAGSTRQALWRAAEEDALKKNLTPGSYVWCLRQRSCQWLPAVVTQCHPNGTYTVTYPFTMGDLLRAKMDSGSHDLLILPSQRRSNQEDIEEMPKEPEPKAGKSKGDAVMTHMFAQHFLKNFKNGENYQMVPHHTETSEPAGELDPAQLLASMTYGTWGRDLKKSLLAPLIPALRSGELTEEIDRLVNSMGEGIELNADIVDKELHQILNDLQMFNSQ